MSGLKHKRHFKKPPPHPAPKAAGFPDWPNHGIAIEGDFAGIQNYVLKPVPGARGAAKRLRGRSLLVSVFTQLIAGRVMAVFPQNRLVYRAGGRFLIVVPFDAEWETKTARLRTDIAGWAFGQFHGEVVFHLAAVE